MNRRTGYKVAGIVVMLGALLGSVLLGCTPDVTPTPTPSPTPTPTPTPTPSDPSVEVIELNCQSAFGIGSWDYLSGERAIRRMEEQSGGRLKINYLAPGEIVAPFEQIDAVNRGVLDMGQAWTGYWIGKDSSFAHYSSVTGGPWGMDTFDHMAWLEFGGGYQLYWDLFPYLGYNDIYPSYMVKGEFPEPLGWFQKRIEKWEDLQGVKMRAAGFTAMVFEEAGMTVQTVPGGEILPLLERGVIDAAEYSDPHSDLMLGIMDVCKYYHGPGIHQPTGYVEIMFNRGAWEQFPDDLKGLIESVTYEMMLKNTLEEYQKGMWALSKLVREHDVELVHVSDDILLRLLEASDKVMAEEAEGNPMFGEILESQRQYAEWLVPYRDFWFPSKSMQREHYWPDLMEMMQDPDVYPEEWAD